MKDVSSGPFVVAIVTFLVDAPEMSYVRLVLE